MCVIIHTKRKELLKKRELEEAMRSNSAGFFLAILKGDGTRRVLRTLDAKSAEEFWDSAPKDAEMVMHFRIPSRGDKNLENVHGWEEDGILFSHNMTLTVLDGVMRQDEWGNTDSEYFFRMVFMPLYRAFGAAAYKDGKLCEPLDRVVRVICGTSNRFCFVMPDNNVLRYGDWVGDDPSRKTPDGKPGFFASNMSYKVYERSYPSYPSYPRSLVYQGGKEVKSASADRFPHSDDSVDVDVDEDYWSGECDSQSGKIGFSPDKVEVRPAVEYGGEVLRELAGDARVLKIALADMVMHNLVGYWETCSETGEGEEYIRTMSDWFFPDQLTDDTYQTSVEAFANLATLEKPAKEDVEDFIETYAMALERELNRPKGKTAVFTPVIVDRERVAKGVESLVSAVDCWCRAANLHFDWNSPSGEEFATTFVMETSRRGRPYMDTVCWDDLLYAEDVTGDDAVATVELLLRAIHKAKDAARKEKA